MKIGKFETELKVGFFVILGISLVMISVLMLGGPNSLFSNNIIFKAHFGSVDGLIPGAKIVLGGLHVGDIAKVDFDPERKDVLVTLLVNKKYENWIRQDSRVEIATQGLLGDKYLSISVGDASKPLLEAGSEIQGKAAEGGLPQFLSKGDQLLVSLVSISGSMDRLIKSIESSNKVENTLGSIQSTTKNLAEATDKLNKEIDHLQLRTISGNLAKILEKVNSGTGTLGALVNDPSLFDDLRTFVGGANRNKVVRNLVRQTIKNSDEKSQEAPK